MPEVIDDDRPNGRAGRDHPLADAERVRVAELERVELAVLDLEHREVGLRVAADQLGLEVTLVVGADRDLVGALDHVRVGEDVAVLRHHEPGAEALLRLLHAGAAELGSAGAEEVIEEVAERVLLTAEGVRLRRLPRALLRRVLHATPGGNAHHRRAHVVGHVFERRRQLMREANADVARGGGARGRVIRSQRRAASLLRPHLGVERVATGGRQSEREHGRQCPGDVTALTIDCDHGLFSF